MSLSESSYDYKFEHQTSRVFDTCCICGESISYGDRFLEAGENIICDDCIHENIKIAGEE